MARQHRSFISGFPLHLVQRGNNRNALFRSSEDYRSYLTILLTASKAERCDVHAYVLMTNHVHLLLTPPYSGSVSRLMKRLHQEYAQLHNRKYARSGGLYEGRYRASIVQTERYLLLCQRYIELNPVRAGMVARPEDYRWSSYRQNVAKESSALLTPHPLCAALSPDEYRSLFLDAVAPMDIDSIRQAINRNQPVGDDGFVTRYATKSCSNGGV